MRERLSIAPWWVQGLLAWVVGAPALVLVTTLLGRFSLTPRYTWNHALTSGLLQGVLLSAVAAGGVAFRGRSRRQRTGVAALSPQRRKEALRAAAGGAVPDDSSVRDAAWRYVDDLLGSLVRQRPVLLLIAVALAVGAVLVLNTAHSVALFLLLVVAAIGGPLGNEVQIRHLRRRAGRLID